MPFIRYTRDKRGYETTFVMHSYRPAQGPQRTRVLYLFRSPSHVHLGRRPLDEESREALEHTHPDLSFDWSALGRESDAVRAEETRERPSRGHRQSSPRQPRAAAPMPVTVDDQSVLGRAVGADVAARLRTRHADLLQRIARRARTPEERDRLTEQARRLNPDDWSDAETARARARTIEAEWDAVIDELPARRRGRRGGRRREGRAGEPSGESNAPDTAGATDAPDASGIMAPDGEVDASEHTDQAAVPADAAGDRADDRAGGADDDGAAGNRLPGDDEFRQD